MDYEGNKRRRDEDGYSGGGRGRDRNFGNRGGGGYDRHDGGDRYGDRRDGGNRSYDRRDNGNGNGGGYDRRNNGGGDYGRNGGGSYGNGNGFGDRDRNDNGRGGWDRNEGGGSFNGRGGGRGGYRGSRGGGGGGYGGGDFHKAPGGDVARTMPDSEEYKSLVGYPNFCGSEGKSIQLIGNFYHIIHSDIKVHHYDVSISKIRVFRKDSKKPDDGPTSTVDGDDGQPSSTTGGDSPQKPQEPSLSEERKMAQERFIKKFADKIVNEFAKSCPDVFQGAPYAYDGWKNVYTTGRLHFTGETFSKSIETDIDGRMAGFRVTLRMVDIVSMADAVSFYSGNTAKPISERIISVFEIILRTVIGKSYDTYQRKFFDLADIEHSPKVKLVDFVQGFVSAVRQAEFGLALNIHLKTSAIISKSYTKLLDLVCDILNMGQEQLSRGTDRKLLFAVNKIIRHLKMYTKHGKRQITYTIDSLVEKVPERSQFQDKSGEKMSIAEYFLKAYDIKLKSLPMVRASGKNNVHVPLELCYLKDAQFLNKTKFDQNIQRELLFKSTHTPNVYFHKVAKIVNKIKDSDKDGVLKHFGMDLNTKAARFDGRILPAPHNRNANPNQPFVQCCKDAPGWAVFCLETRQFQEPDLQRFACQMADTAGRFGLRLGSPEITACVDVTTLDDVKNIFYNLGKKTNVGMVFVGIPTRHQTLTSSDIYAMVKHACDQKYGIMSQCFKTDVIPRMPRGYFDNFLLKVNGKLDGQNSALDPSAMEGLPFKPSRTMMVGIDVNHPAPDSGVASSVAAAVGSYDECFSRYNATICVQRKEHDEMVNTLHEMIADLLFQYSNANGYFPDNLVVFRDGVSDGQFNKVLEVEIPLIKRACSDVGHKVNLTVIVVQKRHHTRFALAQQDTNGRKPTWNVPSGTVVDKCIVDPTYKGFYLNSHFSPLGTSKPSKYVIIMDDLNLTADQVQKLCFYSCFNSTRTRNVIAIPTPVRYADLLAYRSKMHIEAQRPHDGQSTMSSRSGGSAHLNPDEEEAIIRKLNDQAKLHENVKHRLFYC